MAICPEKKIDSNATGLRYAEERCLGELYPNSIWNQLEPNSYSDFGSTITTVARNPINASRSRRKGVVTDLEASGGFSQDVTAGNTLNLLQGFLFADAREHGTTNSLRLGGLGISAVDGATGEYEFNNVSALSAVVSAGGTGYRVGDLLFLGGGQVGAAFYVASTTGAGVVATVSTDNPGLYAAALANPVATTTDGGGAGATLTVTWTTASDAFLPGQIVLASGFASAGNNGIKTVDAYTSGVLGVVEALTTEVTPLATARVQAIGHAFAADDVSIVMNGLLPQLTDVAAGVDFTTWGLIPGEWVYLAGFAGNEGFARISVITDVYMEFDKTDWTPVAEAAGGVTATLYFGTVIRNESDMALIKRRTYQLERTLGSDADGVMSEYLIGSVPNEFTLNVPQADKVTADFTFISTDHEPRTGAEGIKDGTRPALGLFDAFNTSSDFSRIKLALVDETDPNPQPLFAFATDLTLTVSNNASPLKAVGNLGAIDVTAGTFEVGGSLTVYFADIVAVRAVRNNADVTLDFAMVKNNTGMLFDVPLLALGNGRLNVEQDQAITLPLDTSGAESKFGHTLLVQYFPYLPDSAA